MRPEREPFLSISPREIRPTVQHDTISSKTSEVNARTGIHDSDNVLECATVVIRGLRGRTGEAECPPELRPSGRIILYNTVLTIKEMSL